MKSFSISEYEYPLNIFWPLALLKVARFLGYRIKRQDQTADFREKYCRSVSLTSLLEHCQYSTVQWMSVGRRWPVLIFRTQNQRSRSKCWSVKKCQLNIFLPLCLKVATLGTVNACRQNITPIDVQVTWLKVTVVKLLIFKKKVVRSTFAGKLPF